MDKDWLKLQMRRAGITSGDLADAIGRDRAVASRILNGHQKATLDQARIFATRLEADLPSVLQALGLADAPVAQQLSPGFADGDAAPWVEAPRPNDPARAIAAALGADRPGVDVWRVRGGAMALAGLLPGDFMLVDTHAAERARAGDVVIAQLYRPAGRDMTARTVLRRLEPPVLVAASADPDDARVHVVDGVNVLVRGKVLASWRM